MDLVFVSMFRRVVGEEKVTLISCFCTFSYFVDDAMDAAGREYIL